MMQFFEGVFVWLSPEEDALIIENVNKSVGATASDRLHYYLQKCAYRDPPGTAPSEAHIDRSFQGSWWG